MGCATTPNGLVAQGACTHVHSTDKRDWRGLCFSACLSSSQRHLCTFEGAGRLRQHRDQGRVISKARTCVVCVRVWV